MHEYRGLSIAIAFLTLGFCTALAFILVAVAWIALSVYAIIKMIGSAPDSADPTVVFIIIVLLVTTLVAGLAGLISLLGRPMTPRKRGDRLAPDEKGSYVLPD